MRAKPRAAPIKGAVQGDATITAKAPVRNELNGPEPSVCFSNLPKLPPILESVTR